jgi:tripartite-type tricarboxylate transporter receptor subunit TctC
MIKKTGIILVCLFLSALATAQDLTNTIQLVVPFAPGGPVDSVARFVQLELSKELNTPIIVINKAGAGGVVGANYVLENKSKNITLLLHSPAVVINPILGRANYDVTKDFKLVGYLGYAPFVLIANNKLPYNSVKDLRQSAQPISIGNSGVGSTSYLVNEQFKNYFPPNKFIDVSYAKGGAELSSAVVTGVVDLTIGYSNTAVALINHNQVKPLAVANPTRLSLLPTVPTFKEIGMPDVTVSNQYFLLTHNDISSETLAQLRKAIETILEKRSTKLYYSSVGIELGGRVNLNTFLETQTNQYKKILTNVVIKND